MIIPRQYLIASLLLFASLRVATAADSKPHLTLPAALYAVSGVQMNIDFRNTILAEPEEGYQFKVECKIGKVEGNRRWSLKARKDEIGDYPLKMSLIDSTGNLVNEATTMIRVVPHDSGAGREITLLIVGDSLTSATYYPNEVGKLLSAPGNPEWVMLGTSPSRGATEGVAREGYGGWTWLRFNTLYEEEKWKTINGRERRSQSPFLFVDGKGADAKLDIERYIREEGNGRKPDYVTFLLGINDCFHADPNDPKAVEAKFAAMTGQAEILIAAFRKALPDADLGVCLTPPPNSRDEAFVANYKDRYTRKGWRSIQYRLVERQLEHFGGREKEHVYIVPTSLDLDPVNGYPKDNGVHPNENGYARIGTSIYEWLKWRMAVKEAVGE